jgi:hypothetical protein
MSSTSTETYHMGTGSYEMGSGPKRYPRLLIPLRIFYLRFTGRRSMELEELIRQRMGKKDTRWWRIPHWLGIAWRYIVETVK